MLTNKKPFIKLDQSHLNCSKIILLILVSVFLFGCNPTIKDTETPVPAATQVSYPNAADAHDPILKGTISGLPDGVFATVTARLFSETSGGVYGLRENGAYEMEAPYDENEQRKVFAEAGGFLVQPSEYVIYFKDGKAFLVQDGIQTDQEAVNLDFVFSALSQTKTP